MKDADKKEIKIEFVEDDKVSITVHNICIDCVIDKLKKITKQLIEDRDRIAEAVEDGGDDCCEAPEIDEEDEKDLLKKAPDFPSFDDAYSTYKKAKAMAKESFADYGVKADTIPDSFAKVLSIMESDEQIRNDMFKLLAGYVTNESLIKKDSKKKKK
jgi:hypothetical protein